MIEHPDSRPIFLTERLGLKQTYICLLCFPRFLRHPFLILEGLSILNVGLGLVLLVNPDRCSNGLAGSNYEQVGVAKFGLTSE